MAHKVTNFAYMPNTSDVDPEMLLNCPYDIVHRVFAKRFPYHVMKCRKNHIGANMSICPFNARHIVPISELRHHVANCPDRCTIEPDIAYAQAQDGSYLKGDTSVPSYHHDFQPPFTENWDTEGTTSSSKRRHAEHDKPEVIHNMVGMTKAQRKEFNRKLLELGKDNGEATNSDEDVSALSVQPMEGMRRPKQLPKAASVLDQRAYAAQYGVINSFGQSTHHGPHGLGRSVLVANHIPVPRPGTTVQGRVIAANIFNSLKDTQKDLSAETSEAVPARAPTVSMAPTNTAPSLPITSAVTPNHFNNTPPNMVPNLAGLGRGLGVPVEAIGLDLECLLLGISRGTKLQAWLVHSNDYITRDIPCQAQTYQLSHMVSLADFLRAK